MIKMCLLSDVDLFSCYRDEHCGCTRPTRSISVAARRKALGKNTGVGRAAALYGCVA